ncbi:hypothetical protein PTI98_005614 [Pleurotus ostreatus]|nr:hypothetical protein PTI98_005614 [Pleurotus ostreatus]
MFVILPCQAVKRFTENLLALYLSLSIAWCYPRPVPFPTTMVYNPQSVNAIIKDQLYLGNLAAAQSVDLRKKIGITHIVSVCPEYPSTGPNHLAIAVHDSEYENLLIHLPNACRFIQAAMDNGGKVLVHCVMGISRSTTVVCAYLMKTRRMSPSSAIRFVRRWRPCVHPNYGFVRQLHAFADCGYDPSPENKAYIAWKRSQSRNVTNFLKTVVDTTPVIPEQLYLSSDFPKDPEQAEALLLDLGITHFLTLSPAECATNIPSVKYHHKNIGPSKDSLLLALPEICDFINEAITNDGEVLIYSVVESRACTAACAYCAFIILSTVPTYSLLLTSFSSLSDVLAAHPSRRSLFTTAEW